MATGDIRAFDWEATMGFSATVMTSIVYEYLNTLQQLFKGDRLFLQLTAQTHTCAVDDPFVYLDHMRRSGLMSTLEDFRLWDKAYECIVAKHPRLYSEKWVERRMRQADGSCPLCGHLTRFRCVSEPTSDNLLDRTSVNEVEGSRCIHLRSTRIIGHPGGALRKARTWSGKHWPYDCCSGEKLTDDDGKAINPDGAAKCSGCAEMHQHVQMEKAFFQLLQDGWNWDGTYNNMAGAVSYYCCRSPVCPDKGLLKCDHAYMAVKLAMQDARFGRSSVGAYDGVELRLDGAGVKLIIRPARADILVPGLVHSGMFVAGDLVHKYPGFADHAQRLFAKMGIPTKTAV